MPRSFPAEGVVVPSDPPAEGVRSFDVPDVEHTDLPLEYDVTPPVGGKHDAVPQACGFYKGTVRSENAVYSLEHGAVWITYRPNLSESKVSILRRLADESAKVLAARGRITCRLPSSRPLGVVSFVFCRLPTIDCPSSSKRSRVHRRLPNPLLRVRAPAEPER